MLHLTFHFYWSLSIRDIFFQIRNLIIYQICLFWTEGDHCEQSGSLLKAL